MAEVISRDEALRLGLTKFFTGIPCIHGHISPRYVTRSTCMDCALGRASVWHRVNKDKKSKAQDRYRKNNLGYFAAKEARRRATKFDATPHWLSPQQLQEIEDIYQYAQTKGYHVDHIVPLKNKKVCGMHVPWNLQAIPPQENLMKHNNLVEV